MSNFRKLPKDIQESISSFRDKNPTDWERMFEQIKPFELNDYEIDYMLEYLELVEIN